MLTLKRKTDYAFVALAKLAQQQLEAPELPLSCRQIADEFGMPLQQLMANLKDLQRAGIVTSTRGAHGGYHLPDAPESIKLTRVIEAIEGPVQITVCCEEDEAERCLSCEIEPKCPITSKVREINSKVYEFLEQFTLADLMPDENGNAGRVELFVSAQGIQHAD